MERERIVVGVDGSSGSQDALRWALAEACRRTADVAIVYCWSPPYLAMSSGYAVAYMSTEDVSAEAHVHLEQAMAACRDEIAASEAAGLTVSTTVLEGDAGWSLVSEAKEAALLVVGRRGHAGLSHFVLGSVSRYVTTHAHCPVVVVPETD
jgi:nucleotide-binding universal stress UspA family protein